MDCTVHGVDNSWTQPSDFHFHSMSQDTNKDVHPKKGRYINIADFSYSEKVGLKLNIQKTKIMASGPIITSWQIDGETVETVADFIFLGSKITADGDCSHKIKRHLLLGRKVTANLDSI